MSNQISKKSIAILLIATVAGLLMYSFAPQEIQPGDYQVTLIVDAPTITLEQEFDVLFSEDAVSEEATYFLNGTETDLEVTISNQVPIDTRSELTIVVVAVGESITAEDILVHIDNDSGFHIELRPTKQSGQTFTIAYQPLVRSQAAVMILAVVAILWFTEGISLVATSILIPVLLVLTDIRTPQQALMPFFDPAVALIFGGFLIGRAIDKYELDKRLALMILSKSSGSGSRLILTVMAVTSFLSMWISNTASAAIMIPIALAVISRIEQDETREKYGKALVLGVAYAATLGGIATLVGSPPNPLAASYISSFLGIEFSFISWIPFGLPVLLIMLPIIWRYIIFRFKLPKDVEEMNSLKEVSLKEYLRLGPMTTQQNLVVLVFASVVVLWLTEGLPDFLANIIGWSGHGISSSVVALMGGLALLILRLLDEKDVSSEISWGSLLILGSGIALGGAMIDTGLSTFIAQQMSGLGVLPSFIVVVVIGLIAVLVTMVASNTGAAVILIPIAIPLSIGLGIDPLLITMVIAIAVSMDFALPTGTPPSTIAYSTGKLEIREMVSTGLIIDFIAVLVVTIIAVWIWGAFGLVALT